MQFVRVLWQGFRKQSCACGLQRPIISDYVTLRAAAVTVRRPHGRGDRRPEGVHVDYAHWEQREGQENTS
jgi:hypothetical protein